MVPDESLTTRDSLQSLHTEFRSLTVLLTLVNALNNDRDLALLKEPRIEYRGTLDIPQSDHDIALNALVATLVRDDEVIAVTACDSSQTSTSSPPSAGAGIFYCIVVLQEDRISTTSDECLTPNVTHFMLVPRGVSHLEKVIEQPWLSLKIP